MRRYLLSSLILSTVLIIGYYVWQQFDSFYVLHHHFLTLIIFFLLQSLPISWLLRQGEKEASSFVLYAVASIGFRMITGLFFLLAFFFLKVESFNAFAIQFAAIYLIYLVFELMVVLANLRRN